MADETLDELQLRMADALSGRLAPAELAAFRAALERRPELKAEFDLLQQAAQALDGAYPEEPALGQQAWLRIEKSLGWRRAGEGGSSRLEAERFASKARASDESRAEREALESKNLALGDHETVNVGAPRGARARRRDELASARSGAPARSRWWFAAPLAAAVALVVLATRVFQPEPPSNTVATLPSGAPDAAGMEYTYVRGSRADVDDGRGLALLRRLGPVAVYEAERRAWRGVVPGERIPYGAKLRTAAGARAELGFGESRVRLDERTELSIERLDEHARVVHLAQGRVLVDAAPRGLNEPRARAFQGVRVLAAGGQLELRAGQAEVEVPAPDLALARVLKGSAQAACVSSRDSTPALVGLSEGREALLAEAAGREVMDVLATGLKARVAALSQARDRTLPAGEPAAWAADLDKPPGKAEAAVGQLVVQDADGKPAEPLGIAEFNVLAHLRGPLCLTRIDQSFENTTGRTLEGAFYFPLPPGAAIARFAMYVDDKTLVEGEVVERGKARAVYASILREKRDPALLEWMEGNVFRARVFPILPHSRKRIVLEYTQLIPAHYDTRRFVLPLVGEMTSTRPIGSLSVNVVAETLDGMPVHDLVSPSYFEATKVEGLGTPRAVARLNLRDVKPEADFVLNVAAERAGEFFSAVYAEGNEPPYLAVGFQPRPTMEQLAAAGAPKARDVLLVCETSGARSPADLAAQAKALEALLAGFNSGDRVALACADVFFTPLLPGFVPPFAAEVARARADLSARAPLGALNLGAVLEAAAEFAARHGAPERPRLVVFLGAGIPALGALDVGRLAEAGAAGLNKAGARFAGLAVGREVETLALEELARASGGIFAALRPDENLEESAFSLALGLQQPWLEAPVLRAEPDVLNEVYPARLASLRAGHEVFLAARLKEAKPFALALRAKLGGADFERRAGVQLAANLNHDPAVGRFWARARLDRLLARPSSDETRGEIVALAQTWTLMSPYTSFLVLESDAEYARYQIDRARRRPLWRDETVLALAAAPANRLIQQDGEKLESGLKGLNAKQAQDAKAGQKAERGKTHSDRNANIEAAASEPAWQPRPMNRRSLDEAGSRLRALESESQYRARAAKPAEPAAAGPGNQGGGNGARAQVDKSMEKSAPSEDGRGHEGQDAAKAPVAYKQPERAESAKAGEPVASPKPTAAPPAPPGAPAAGSEQGGAAAGHAAKQAPSDERKEKEVLQDAAPGAEAAAKAQDLPRTEGKAAREDGPEPSVRPPHLPQREPAPSRFGRAMEQQQQQQHQKADQELLEETSVDQAEGLALELAELAELEREVRKSERLLDGYMKYSAKLQDLDEPEDVFDPTHDAHEALAETRAARRGLAQNDPSNELNKLQQESYDRQRDWSASERLKSLREEAPGPAGGLGGKPGSGESDRLLYVTPDGKDATRGDEGALREVLRQSAGRGPVTGESGRPNALGDARKEEARKKDGEMRTRAGLANAPAGPIYSGFIGGFREAALPAGDALARKAPEAPAAAKPDAQAAIEKQGGLAGGRVQPAPGDLAGGALPAEADDLASCLKSFWVLASGRANFDADAAAAKLKALHARIQAAPGERDARLYRAAVALLFFSAPERAAADTRDLLLDVLAEDLHRVFAAPDAGGLDGEALREALHAAPGLSAGERLDLLGRQPENLRLCGDWTRLATLQPDSDTGRASAAALLSKGLEAWTRARAERPLPRAQARAMAFLALHVRHLDLARKVLDAAVLGQAADDPRALGEAAGLAAELGMLERAAELTLRALGAAPRDAAHAPARAELYRNLALLSAGADGYKRLADGLAEFRYAGALAEYLAREVLQRAAAETDAKALDAALPLFADDALRARLNARRAELEPEPLKRHAFWRRAYEAAGGSPEYLAPYVESLAATGQEKEARARLEAHLRQGYSVPWMWQQLAGLYGKANDPRAQLRALTQVVALRPREAAPRLELAEALAGLNRRAEAVRELKCACELEPEHAAAHRALLKASREARDRDAEAWALLHMLEGAWLSEDGDLWGEAEQGLKALADAARRAGDEPRAKDLEAKLAAGRVQDLAAILTWDTEATDIDLHVTEPGAHEVSYQAKTSFRGGVLDHDDTDGHGPETYVLKRAAPGAYRIWVKFYGGEKPTQAAVVVYRNRFGPDERKETFTLNLKKAGDEATVLELKVEK